ncbi:trypsin-like peptidase domain-containing protein [Candidatus Methylopumilus planktonicus]|uniref:trypsin-like peptidase domain-containing protein n=1 Tax=Candidatus Methylopumilus planktonicus TaxID=1581557 RepID=UPI003D18A869
MKNTISLFLLLIATQAEAIPTFAKLLELNNSIVVVNVDFPDGSSGTGTGVVVSKEYVATDCHVIANTLGANISKYDDTYKPIAFKADWKHDLCLLKFEELPFTPVPLRDSQTLQYEEDVFSVSYPNGSNVPQPSYGSVKAMHKLDSSVIIRSDAAFALGSSGGGLFDEKYNLIGITTFKSPGPQGFFYSLPVEWIKKLMKEPNTKSLKTLDIPFWAMPFEQKPYFMKVVIPYQNKEWDTLKSISDLWIKEEPNSPDAWYFMGLASQGKKDLKTAKEAFSRAEKINPRHVDAMMGLAEIAESEKDLAALQNIQKKVNQLNTSLAEVILNKLDKLK